MERYNPWWRGKEKIRLDEDFVKWDAGKVKWTPRFISHLNLEPFSLHFLYGPRQVGKTTALKLMIRDLLEKGVDPFAIFYYRCDQLADFREVETVLNQYEELKKQKGIKNSFLFLDEITLPHQWHRTIKERIDQGKHKNDVLVLTGSLSMYVLGEVETFPGRRGNGKDFILHPLSFREFITVYQQGKWETLPSISLKTGEEEFRKKLADGIIFIKELNSLLRIYLQSGGFPLSVKDIIERNLISEGTESTYLSWIKGDLARLKRKEIIAKRIIKGIIEKAPSTISWHSLAKEFELRSHKTVFNYVDLLEKLFLAKTVYFIEPNQGVFNFAKERKIFLTDPFLYRLMANWCLTKPPTESVLAESLVATHLARKYEVGYWKNGREIDCVVKLGESLLGIETKYRKNPEAHRIRTGKIKQVITLTLDSYNFDSLMMPVSLFLAMLKE